MDSINKGTEKSNGALVPYSATAAAERKDAQVEASRDGQEKEGAVENEYSYKLSRRKVIDDTNHEEEMAHLKTICPWLPQFTPQAQVANSIIALAGGGGFGNVFFCFFT